MNPRYIVDSDEGCWLWQRGVDWDGYGRLKVGGRTVIAHRHYYEAYRGPIPEGLTLDHVCEVRACVNPWHMVVVGQDENTRLVNVRAGRACNYCHAMLTDDVCLRCGADRRAVLGLL